MNRIKELRTRLGMNQATLSNIIGVTRSTVSMWEINKSQPDSDMLVRLADLFGVSVDCIVMHDAPLSVQKEKPAEYDGLADDEKTLLALFRQLNTEARDRLIDLADDMVQSGKYMPKSGAHPMAARQI